MEANKFGFRMPPAFKFDPTDADIVAHYLLPRALSLPDPPYAGAIVEEDPGSAPPWEILRRHGDLLDHAFFFGPPTENPAGRRTRAFRGGGVWQGQQSSEHTVTLLRPSGPGQVAVDIRYKRYHLSFYLGKGRGRSTGYVMHEFEIVSPPLPGTVLTRIRVPRKKVVNRQQRPVAPGPAPVTGNGAGGAHADARAPYGYDYSTPLRYALPPLAEYRVSVPDQSAAMMNDGGEAQAADALYGGADYSDYVDPSNHVVPESGGDYSNYYYYGQ